MAMKAMVAMAMVMMTVIIMTVMMTVMMLVIVMVMMMVMMMMMMVMMMMMMAMVMMVIVMMMAMTMSIKPRWKPFTKKTSGFNSLQLSSQDASLAKSAWDENPDEALIRHSEYHHPRASKLAAAITSYEATRSAEKSGQDEKRITLAELAKINDEKKVKEVMFIDCSCRQCFGHGKRKINLKKKYPCLIA